MRILWGDVVLKTWLTKEEGEGFGETVKGERHLRLRLLQTFHTSGVMLWSSYQVQYRSFQEKMGRC